MELSPDKPWGICTPLAQSHITQCDKLLIWKDGYSSLHYHDKKWNLFVVESGQLDIYWLAEPESHTPRHLHPGDHLVIPPGFGNTHQFHAPVQTVIYEFYWQTPESAPLEREEIVRLTKNGRGEFIQPTWRMAKEGRARDVGLHSGARS